MKFNKKLTINSSQIEGVQAYRKAAQLEKLEIITVEPTKQTTRPGAWSVFDLDSAKLFDKEAQDPLEITAFPLRPRSLVIDELTRHRFTSQFFIPVIGGILTAVIKPDSEDEKDPNRQNLQVVPVLPGQCIEINRGTWHTLPFAVIHEVKCLSVMHRESLNSYHDIRDLSALGWVSMIEWSD